MARITVEDCLEKIPNRFALVLIAADRAKQLLKGSGSMLDDDRSNKNKEVVTALREIAAGKVRSDVTNFDDNENLYGTTGTLAHSTDDLPPAADDDLPPAADDDLPPLA